MTAAQATWVTAAVGLGGNLGDRAAALQSGARGLRALPRCRSFVFSPIYETAPVDCREPLLFLNAACVFETRMAPHELLRALLALEDGLGRVRPYPNAPRPLDLDLLLYGAEIHSAPELTVPHPRMHERLFVLVPLAAVAPRLRHPVLGQTVADLHAARARIEQETGVISLSRMGWGDGL